MTICLCSDADKIRENIRQIRERIAEAAVGCGRKPEEIRLLAVTKTVPPERVNLAIEAGVDGLGENRVQEYCEKHQNYRCAPDTIHFIGHLQTNKIRDIIEQIGMVESVDTVHLALALQKEAEKHGRMLPVLLQVNIGMEETKSGFAPDLIRDAALQIAEGCPRLKISGLMAIPPRQNSDSWLGKTNELFENLCAAGIPGTDFHTLSMGMSGDFEDAVRHGSTQVRIGSAIFGART